MAGYDKVILNGDAGDAWHNETEKPHYQFFVSGANTCGVCYQYNHAVSPSSWPIPIHRGCICYQLVVAVGAKAKPWVDFAAEVAALDPKQQAAVAGASNYKLITAGVVQWSDVVTKYRVRDFREVVAIKNLEVKALVRAGVRPTIAEKAFASVHTPIHELVAQQRSQLLSNLNAAGISRDQVRQIVAGGLAARVVGSGPSGRRTLPGSGQTHDQRVRSFLSMWIGQTPPPPSPKPNPKSNPKPEPKPNAEEPQPARPLPLTIVGDVPQAEADRFQAAIDVAVPPRLAEVLAKKKVQFVLANRMVDVMGDEAKKQPSGWPEGTTYENTEAVYLHDGRKAVATIERKSVATGEYSRSHRSIAGMIHEVGHAIDFALNQRPSDSKQFLKAYNADVAGLSDSERATYAYFARPDGAGAIEAFAELFAQASGRASFSKPLKIVFPETAFWMKEFLNQWRKTPASSPAGSTDTKKPSS